MTTWRDGSAGPRTAAMVESQVYADAVAYTDRRAPISVKTYGATGDGSTDDTAAINAALAAATTTGLLSGSANRAVYFPGGTYMVSSMLTAPHAAVLIGDGPDLSIIRAKSSFSFPDNDTAILRSYTATYTAPASLRRLNIKGILVDGNNVTGANGVLATVQQPTAWENWRVINCPGYGVTYANCQQSVSYNGEITNCGVNLRLRGGEFLWFFGLNVEQAATSLVVCETMPSGLSTGQCVFAGLHLEGLTPASGYAIDATDVFGLTFINPYFSNASGQHFFKFSGSKASYKIINARQATSGGSSEFVNDAVNTTVGTVLASTLNSDREAVDFTGGVPVMAQSGIRVGTQTVALTKQLYLSTTVPSISNFAHGDAAQSDFTVTGAAVGDMAEAALNSSGKWLLTAAVTATDTVRVTFLNATGGSTNPGLGTGLKIAVRRFA